MKQFHFYLAQLSSFLEIGLVVCVGRCVSEVGLVGDLPVNICYFAERKSFRPRPFRLDQGAVSKSLQKGGVCHEKIEESYSIHEKRPSELTEPAYRALRDYVVRSIINMEKYFRHKHQERIDT